MMSRVAMTACLMAGRSSNHQDMAFLKLASSFPGRSWGGSMMETRGFDRLLTGVMSSGNFRL